MKVEIWSDVVCPWCYLGKRRFEKALASFEHNSDVELRWRSFELDPGAPPVRTGDPVQRLADKYGMSRAEADAANDRLTGLAAAEGLEYHLDKLRSGNTFDAHRLLHLAADKGVQDDVKERFLRAHFTELEPVGDHPALARVAVDAGLPADDVNDVLATDRYAAAVRADEDQAAAYGITGVPFFVLDGKFGVSGAQSSDVLLQALRQAWAAANPLTMLDGGRGDAVADQGGACDGDSCAV
jgi:predicted DsbA family dithiol-disulfide isomerase